MMYVNTLCDVQDSECYTVLLDQIAPPEAGVDLSPLSVYPLLATSYHTLPLITTILPHFTTASH